MSEIKSYSKDHYTDRLRAVQLYLSIFVVLISFLAQLIYGFVWKSETDLNISALQNKISKLDNTNSTDHEKIIEIGINLKTLMEKSGLNYQSVK